MADFTITILNSINTFAGITNKWNEWNWGFFKWGEGTADLPVAVVKLISETLTPSDALVQLAPDKLISETLSPTGDLSSEVLTDGSGYSYIFVSGVQNAESRSIVSYTSGSDPSVSWASHVSASSIWS